MDTYALLEGAIHRREQVVATYEGEVREFCPHALGTKGRRQHVLAYQFGGSSRSGLPSRGEWRCFTVDLLENAVARPGPWHTAPNIFNPQTCLDEVDVVVQPAPPRAAPAG
jgi:predicted DNA-binding transcriptional regulator YafY